MSTKAHLISYPLVKIGIIVGLIVISVSQFWFKHKHFLPADLQEEKSDPWKHSSLHYHKAFLLEKSIAPKNFHPALQCKSAFTQCHPGYQPHHEILTWPLFTQARPKENHKSVTVMRNPPQNFGELDSPLDKYPRP